MNATLTPSLAEWTRTAKVFTALGDEHRQPRILLLFEKGESSMSGKLWMFPRRPAPRYPPFENPAQKGVLQSEKGRRGVFRIDKRIRGILSAVLDHLKTI